MFLHRFQPSLYERGPPGTGTSLPVGKLVHIISRYIADSVQKYFKPPFHVAASSRYAICGAGVGPIGQYLMGTGTSLPVGKLVHIISRYIADSVQKYFKPPFHVAASSRYAICGAGVGPIGQYLMGRWGSLGCIRSPSKSRDFGVGR